MDWVAIWGRAVRELPVRSAKQWARWDRAVARWFKAQGQPVPAWLSVPPRTPPAIHPECPF